MERRYGDFLKFLGYENIGFFPKFYKNPQISDPLNKSPRVGIFRQDNLL